MSYVDLDLLPVISELQAMIEGLNFACSMRCRSLVLESSGG